MALITSDCAQVMRRDQGPCGVFKVLYSTFKAGRYSVHIAVDGVPIQSSPFTTVVEPDSETSTPSSTAAGLGLTETVAGSVANFNIQARDQFGNYRLISEALKPVPQYFFVEVAYCPNGLPDGDHCRNTNGIVVPTIEEVPCPEPDGEENVFTGENIITNCDMQNSTYAVAYMATVAGLYEINVMRDGEHIVQSPFPMLVLPTLTEVEKTATSMADGENQGIAGHTRNFTVLARDNYGNNRVSGGDYVKANIWYLGDHPTQQTPPFQAENFLSCTSEPHAYTWVTDTSTCLGPEQWFDYTWQDANSVELNQQLEDVDLGNGVYKIPYYTTKSGYYHVDIYLSPLHEINTAWTAVPDSPFTVMIEPAGASTTNSFVIGSGLQGGEVVPTDDDTVTFTIVGVDLYGNERQSNDDGKDNFESTITIVKTSDGGAATTLNTPPDYVTIVNPHPVYGGGKYEASFRPTVAGEYYIVVSLEGQEGITGGKIMTDDVRTARYWWNNDILASTSPFNATFLPTAISAPQCIAEYPVVAVLGCVRAEADCSGTQNAIAGLNAELQITARDRWHNDRTIGGDRFVITLTGPSFQGSDGLTQAITLAGNLTDHGSGRYNVVYRPTISGQ